MAHLIGQSWRFIGQPFDLSPLAPAWRTPGRMSWLWRCKTTAVQAGFWACAAPNRRPNPAARASGDQWVWMPDNNGTNDAATMTATNLDTSSWPSASIGQDAFPTASGCGCGSAPPLDSLATSSRPLTLHFLGSTYNAGEWYLNGALLGQHFGAGQPLTWQRRRRVGRAAGRTFWPWPCKTPMAPAACCSRSLLQSGRRHAGS